MKSPQQEPGNPDDSEVVRQLFDLLQMEANGSAEPTRVTVGPLSAYLLAASLQLAWRHPSIGKFARDFIGEFGRQLQESYRGSPVYDLLERGWDESQDVLVVEFDPEIIGVRVTREERGGRR